jgi:hypothetical protein
VFVTPPAQPVSAITGHGAVSRLALRIHPMSCIKNEQDYDDIVTMGLVLSNDGKPVPSQVNNEYLKTGLGRRLPAMPAIVKDDPWWLDPKDPHRVAYTRQGLLGPLCPAYAQVQKRDEPVELAGCRGASRH